MIVCIAEKPSVARDIADVLGARDKKRIHRGKRIPGDVDVRSSLYPERNRMNTHPTGNRGGFGQPAYGSARFGIKLISNPTYERQFHVIENLMQHADMIINCGDAGQEGELIQRWVMQKAGARCPVKRLWISSLTEEAIREGFCKVAGCFRFSAVVRGWAFACYR